MSAPLSGSKKGSPDNPSVRAGASASVASARLHALATLSGSLTDALSPHDAANLVEQKALTALGATSAVVVTLGPFPPNDSNAANYGRLHLVHAIGVSEEVTAALRELPLDAPVPFAEVARSGDALFFESKQELRSCGEWATRMAESGAAAAAIVPVWANGELRGVLGLFWPEARVFDDDERAFVLTLGVMCAQAILRAFLRAAELGARDLAEQANRSKTDFLTMISHELRTPMNAVLGYNELLARGLDGPITPRQGEHLERMRESSAHLLDLIEELLGYARLEAGRDEVRPEPVELVDVIRHTLDIIRPLAEKKRLRVGLEHPEGPLKIYTDQRKLRQILVNLLANAVKFTESGGVTLVVRVEGEQTAIKIVFEVADTGTGISEDAQTHLFDAFWQKHPEAALTHPGSGLGLPIARRLARLLGGEVELVASSENGGSMFRLTLPERYTPLAA